METSFQQAKPDRARTSLPIPDLVLGALWIPLRNRSGEVVAYTLIDEQDGDLARFTWHLNPGGYAAGWAKRRSRGRGTDLNRTQLMHRIILGAPPGVEVDHVNRNRLDNRRSNLRFATDGENARNRERSRRNTSGYKGVQFDRVTGRWSAAVRYEGKTYGVGQFESPELAAFAYDFAAAALHGEFAATNSWLAEATKYCAREFRVFLLSEGAEESDHAIG